MINFDEELNKVGLTREAYESCLADIRGKVIGGEDKDWSEIANSYSLPLSPDTIRKASSMKPFGGAFVYEYFKDKGTTNAQTKYKTESSINKDGSVTSDKLIAITEDELKSPTKLLEAHGFDITKWQLVNARNNIWNVYSKDDGIQELYSSKVTVKPRSDISLEEIQDFYASLVKKYPAPKVSKYEDNSGDLCLEVNICDLHLGKLAHASTVGADYNSDIARDCFNQVIDEAIRRCKDMNISKVLFPIGNDLLNFDTFGGTTTGGTPQDNDGKHQEVFKAAVLMLIDGISRLSEELQTKVDVFCIQGNHDFVSSYHLLMALWCYFNNNENVEVDTGMSPRKYRQWGCSLIGFGHGDKEGKRIAGIMPVEAPEMWSETTYREWHLGHLHSCQMREESGVIVRNLPSVTSTDAWHHNSGFVGAVRQCICFVWDKNKGLDSTFNVLM